MEWDYKSVEITLHRSGEFHLQDLEEHKRVLTDTGWEYIGMRALPQKDIDIAQVIMRFRKRREAPAPG
jgi:hypothetical protein